MEAIKQQIAELKTVWAEVYPVMRANPTAWQPHLPNLFAEQIDEVMETISTWADEIAAPRGFKPSFHLAKGVIATALPQLLATAKSLQKGEFNYLPTFVSGLNQILSALHSMVVFSSKAEGRRLSADLSAQLGETLALLGTAQRELSAKVKSLEKASDTVREVEAKVALIKELEQKFTSLIESGGKLFEKIAADTQNQTTKIVADLNAMATEKSAETEARLARLNTTIEGTGSSAAKTFESLASDTQNRSTKILADLDAKITSAAAEIDARHTRMNTATESSATALINGLKEQTGKSVETISELQAKAGETLASAKEDGEKVKALRDSIQAVLTANETLAASLKDRQTELWSLENESKAQQLLIKKLLPDAASAGLAEAFDFRAKQLTPTKYGWMATFILSVSGLMAFSIWYVSKILPGVTGAEVWIPLVERLPLAAPIIWLGWFSAIQYGNTIRVQEDYAFKSATSKAFAGYRDHMEHLANVKLDDANNAMKLLAGKTIEILSREPLRIYQKTHKDATPTASLMAFFKGEDKSKAEKKASLSKAGPDIFYRGFLQANSFSRQTWWNVTEARN